MSPTQKKAEQLHKNVPPDWYSRSIKENLLQRYWHNRRFAEVSSFIEPRGGRILDVGCADGTFTKVILERSKAHKIVGIDVLPKSVSYAKRRFARSQKLEFRVADAHKLPFPSKSFDCITCLETLEHVEDPEKVIAEIKRVLKDDGYMIVLVPSENFLFRYIVWPLWTLGRGRVWRGTHLHKFTGSGIVRRMKKSGLKIHNNHKFLLGMLQAVKATKK